jgi:two-component system chemotaxis sensor kinase CheA
VNSIAHGNDDLRSRLLATFQIEAAEHLEALTAGLLSLERGLASEQERGVVEATFREMHTLKGAARSVGLAEIERLCTACESVLSRVARGGLRLTPGIVGGLQDAIDGIARLLAGDEQRPVVGQLVARLEQTSAGPAEPAPPPRPPADAPVMSATLFGDTIRLQTAKLDTLLVRAEDLLLPRLAAAERAEEARALADTLTRCRGALQRAGSDGAGASGALEQQLRAAESQAAALRDSLRHDQRRIAVAVDALSDKLRRVRMTGASAVLDLFPRMVRDLAAQQGKEVDWDAGGADLEVDRRVLEAVKDPLIHLVRNGVGHGIEQPAERTKAGKPPRGRVAVSVVALERGRIAIQVDDDGRGCDPAAAKAAAVRARQLTVQEAEALADTDALALLYRSGVSTSATITDIAGHGLGLAIAKECVDRLDGEITLESRPGKGTAVRMVLPATIAGFRGLLVRAGGQPLLLSLDAVERVLRVSAADVGIVEGRDTLFRDGAPLRVARLDVLLQLPQEENGNRDDDRRPCVVIRAGGERAGLLVDDVLGTRDLLVKDFGPPLTRVRHVAAAGLLGSGEIVLILRPADLAAAGATVGRRPAVGAEAPARETSVLVADDSFTTRTMEKHLLEAAGYRVRTAVDGVDAWTALKSEPFDLLVSDVDMPRMDGLELTERVRQDRELADLPVVLVTALESDESKERGIEVGANAYIVKSSFDQSNLLEVIRRLV